MKAIYVMIASGLAGAALGVGMTWANFGDAPPLEPGRPIATTVIGEQGSQPKVIVDQPHHDFGIVEVDSPVSHAFRITNVGTGTLTLKAGATTCTACTIAELTRQEVPPGETAEVVVTYSPQPTKPDFKQIATILTNDPEQPRVELNIRGVVMRRFRVLPTKVVMSNVSANEPATAEVRIFCFLSDHLRVVDHALTVADSAPYFEVTTETIPRHKLTEPNAKSGCRVLVKLKPGLPLGPFQQTIRLTVESGENAERTPMEVWVDGAIVSDLSIVGPGWSSDNGILTIGNVDSGQGAKRHLYLLARGAARRDLAIEPVKLDPPWLQVTLGEPTDLNDSVTRIPLTVEIHPGRPPAIYLGTDQGKYGEIILGVKNHPDVKEIRMYLKFVIENGN